MTLKSSGLWCDVCGNPILIDDYFDFTITASEKKMHCCGTCNGPFAKAGLAKDWKLLPDGPLKKAFEEANK